MNPKIHPLSSRVHGQPRSTRSRSARTRPVACEAVEGRRLFSVFFNLGGPTGIPAGAKLPVNPALVVSQTWHGPAPAPLLSAGTAATKSFTIREATNADAAALLADVKHKVKFAQAEEFIFATDPTFDRTAGKLSGDQRPSGDGHFAVRLQFTGVSITSVAAPASGAGLDITVSFSTVKVTFAREIDGPASIPTPIPLPLPPTGVPPTGATQADVNTPAKLFAQWDRLGVVAHPPLTWWTAVKSPNQFTDTKTLFGSAAIG